MPQVGIKFAGRDMAWEEARAEAENPEFPFPPPLVEAMAQQRQDQVPSVSALVGCLRQFELKRTTAYYEEGTAMLPALFGTAFHEYMDAMRQRITKPGDLIERRLDTLVEVDTVVEGSRKVLFSGKPDFFAPGRLVADWKSKMFIPQGFTPPLANIRQVNIYNWLAAEVGYQEAPQLELTYVSQAWVMRHTEVTAALSRVGAYVRKRLNQWAAARASNVLPPPVPELFLNDARGNLAAPCRYCPVREACLAALKDEAAVRPFEGE